MDERLTVGQKLRIQREASNLSQKQIADALNIDRSTYTNYELDKTQPNLETIVKIANIFNVPTQSLLPSDDGGDSLTYMDSYGADSPIYQLSKDERSLIVKYRALKKEQKAELHYIMSNLSKKE